ncbi:MAG: hypothetical protein R3B47_05315 [Bacteroidia bacterium]
MQGYYFQTDEQLTALAFGHRFAILVCASLLIIAVSTASVALLSLMFMVALMGFYLPFHPFDYIYNGLLADELSEAQTALQGPYR